MMRNLIFGLLLVNLLLLAWGRWIVAPDVDDPRAYAGATEARLVLLERAGGAAGIGNEAVIPVVTEGERCFRLGPFPTADAAAAVGDRLSARGAPVEQASEPGQIWVGHWVQLLDLPSDEAARQAVNGLVGGGIRDAYIYSREPTIDISLGVFRGREGAENVVRVARGLGYPVEMTDRFRDGIAWWIETRAPADGLSEGPPDLADLPVPRSGSGAAQIIRVEERS